MTEMEKPTAAFIISLIAGIFIIIGGGAMSMFSSWMGNNGAVYGMMSGYGGYSGMMGGYRGWSGMMGPGFGMMGGLGYGSGFIGVVGIIFGAIVISSAFMLKSKPEEHVTFGTLIVIFSALSILGSALGGLGVGLILGLIGGILAVTWKPVQQQSKT